MAANYTTVARVVRLLGWVDNAGDHPTPDANTIPIADEITESIEAAESEIESYCNTYWREVTIPDEYHAAPQNYFKWYSTGFPIQLKNKYVKAWDRDQGDRLYVWQSEQFNELTDVGNGPLDGDFYIDRQSGIVWLHSHFPAYYQENAFKITYRCGQTTVPAAIRRASTYLAASYLIEAGFDWVYNLVEQDTSMSNAEKSQRWEERAFKLAKRYQEMFPVPQH